MSNEIRLYDTYFSELKKEGCELCVDEPPIGSSLTRSYHSGKIIYGELSYVTKLIRFATGNFQILSIEGEQTDKLLELIATHKKKRWFPLAFRTLFRYIYYLATPCLSVICLYCFLHGMWGAFFRGFILMNVFRFFYAEGRNYLR